MKLNGYHLKRLQLSTIMFDERCFYELTFQTTQKKTSFHSFIPSHPSTNTPLLSIRVLAVGVSAVGVSAELYSFHYANSVVRMYVYFSH